MKNLNLTKFAKGLKDKSWSAEEITKEYLKNIEEKDGSIHAFLRVNAEKALKTAKEVDSLIAENKEVSPIAGAPIALKDNMLSEGEKVTAGSKILENYIASYDGGVISKLKDQKVVILGRTNLDEFAMGSSTENSAYQTTLNPRDTERVAGGSSGGSAAAVGGDMALAALGSDTGGSIRQPAAFCGVVGMKPTYGTVSRSGLIAMASSLDQIGPFTKTVADARLLYDHIQGYDPLDSTSSKENNVSKKLSNEDALSLTIGLPKEYFGDGMSPEVQSAIEKAKTRLQNIGFKFKEISLPHTSYALSTYYIVMPAEVSANLARFDGVRYDRKVDSSKLIDLYLENRGAGFGKEVKRRIILGSFVLSSGYYDAYYAKAQQVRALISNDFEEAFRDVDVIFTPVTPTVAFKPGEKVNDPLAMYLSDIFTIPLNLAGLPGISIPCKEISGLPVGFQLIGRKYKEGDILSIGEMYEAD